MTTEKTNEVPAGAGGCSLEPLDMLKQDWFCEECGHEGTVRYDERSSGVWEVAQRIRECHRIASGGCTTDPRVRLEHIEKLMHGAPAPLRPASGSPSSPKMRV